MSKPAPTPTQQAPTPAARVLRLPAETNRQRQLRKRVRMLKVLRECLGKR